MVLLILRDSISAVNRRDLAYGTRFLHRKMGSKHGYAESVPYTWDNVVSMISSF